MVKRKTENSKMDAGTDREGDARGAWQRAQEAQAARHTAPLCAVHRTAFAVCGCEPEGEAA